MAPADAGDFLLDEDDDDFFGEYNPHPYRGGYDLAATFGTPLPPSANTCYPVSSSTAATVPNVPSPPSPTPEPEEPYGDQEAPREPVHESPEVFPNGAATKGKRRRGGWCGRGFWRKCVRGLDYVFGYKDPYVEQWIGVDSYMVHANRKESGEDALALEVEVPAPSVGRVEPHDGSEELVQGNVGSCFLYPYLLTSSFLSPYCISVRYHACGSIFKCYVGGNCLLCCVCKVYRRFLPLYMRKLARILCSF
jgi:hypothetical protein